MSTTSDILIKTDARAANLYAYSENLRREYGKEFLALKQEKKYITAAQAPLKASTLKYRKSSTYLFFLLVGVIVLVSIMFIVVFVLVQYVKFEKDERQHKVENFPPDSTPPASTSSKNERTDFIYDIDPGNTPRTFIYGITGNNTPIGNEPVSAIITYNPKITAIENNGSVYVKFDDVINRALITPYRGNFFQQDSTSTSVRFTETLYASEFNNVSFVFSYKIQLNFNPSSQNVNWVPTSGNNYIDFGIAVKETSSTGSIKIIPYYFTVDFTSQKGKDSNSTNFNFKDELYPIEIEIPAFPIPNDATLGEKISTLDFYFAIASAPTSTNGVDIFVTRGVNSFQIGEFSLLYRLF